MEHEIGKVLLLEHRPKKKKGEITFHRLVTILSPLNMVFHAHLPLSLLKPREDGTGEILYRKPSEDTIPFVWKVIGLRTRLFGLRTSRG